MIEVRSNLLTTAGQRAGVAKGLPVLPTTALQAVDLARKGALRHA
jgi:hypothetical protein